MDDELNILIRKAAQAKRVMRQATKARMAATEWEREAQSAEAEAQKEIYDYISGCIAEVS